MTTQTKKFNALNVSSKFAICGLPIRVDTYKTCSFGCTYCFANCRKIMEFQKTLQIGDVDGVRKRLSRIFDRGQFDGNNFLDKLISDDYTWHCGGMSDPFQPVEKEYGITRRLIDVTKEYGISILFSTKSDTVYGADIDPELHTFQLSVTNVDDRKDIEPNVPSIESRWRFYKALKRGGYRVGIRIQPFMPNVTSLDIIDMFRDADNFTVEGIKIVPQNKEHKEFILSKLGLRKEDFVQMGLLNLKPEIRLRMYEPFIERFEKYGVPYAIADNDLHYIGNQFCCCGDRLVRKPTRFNNTTMLHLYGTGYTKEQIDDELRSCGVCDCKCNQLFTSNRQEGCVTVQDFFDKRFDRPSSPFSPKFLYENKKKEVICEQLRLCELCR